MTCSISNPCDCMLNGYLRVSCGPEKYRWAIDRLVKEFGEDHVRIGWELDYGRTQKITVSSDWKIEVIQWTLMGRHPEDEHLMQARWYDLNDNRADLDQFIEHANGIMRGFGQ